VGADAENTEHPAGELGVHEDLEGGEGAAASGAHRQGPDAPNKKSSGDDTAETLGNQGNSPLDAASAPLTGPAAALVQQIHQSSANVVKVLVEKEGLQLAFVRYRWPRPYYVRWKGEANDLFALAVALKRRREAIEKAASKAG
jgi:hypothetical protein